MTREELDLVLCEAWALSWTRTTTFGAELAAHEAETYRRAVIDAFVGNTTATIEDARDSWQTAAFRVCLEKLECELRWLGRIHTLPAS